MSLPLLNAGPSAETNIGTFDAILWQPGIDEMLWTLGPTNYIRNQ